jgi:hypothetical protein
MNPSEHPRQRIRPLFMLLMTRLRALPASGIMGACGVRLIREFGVACYELAQEDVMSRSTLPAPKHADHESVTGSYSIVEPRRQDSL